MQISTPSRRWAVVVVTGLVLILAQPVAAQTVPDSTGVSYSEEETSEAFMPPDSKLGQRISQLTRVQVEEQRLWKLGLNSFIFAGTGVGAEYGRFGVHLIYERKLRPAWSVMGEVSPDVLRYREIVDGPWRTGFAVRSQVAGRYYYNMNRRIRKGKSASNFSANYLALGLGAGFGRRSDETPYHVSRVGQPVRLTLAALYGIQRRLGRYGFVDFHLGLPFPIGPEREPSSGLVINLVGSLRIGLALGR